MEAVTGYVVLGGTGAGILIGLFALAYEMVKDSNDVRKVIDALKREVQVLDMKVRKPDLVQINRLIKISYKILKSPLHKQQSKEHIPELVRTMIDVKNKLSTMDYIHAERNNLNSLVQLNDDSVERLKGIIQYYKTHR